MEYDVLAEGAKQRHKLKVLHKAYYDVSSDAAILQGVTSLPDAALLQGVI